MVIWILDATETFRFKLKRAKKDTAFLGKDRLDFKERSRGYVCILLVPSFASSVAEHPSVVLLFDVAVFQNWFGSSHDFREFVFESMAARLANMVGLVEQVTFERMDSQLAKFLLQRYSERCIPEQVIAKTHEEIAEFCD